MPELNNTTKDKEIIKEPSAGYSSGAHWLYIVFVGLVFFVLVIVFIFFPRPSYSELEKRELTSFPRFEDYKDNISKYPSAISSWFSDSQPYRDDFMALSMTIRDLMRYRSGNDEEAITFIASDSPVEDDAFDDMSVMEEAEETDPVNPMADANAKISNAGIIIAGNPPNVRAMMAFGGSSKSGGAFIDVVNSYAEEFPELKIHAIVASSAGEFYLPDKARKSSKPEGPTLNHIKEDLNPRVNLVNVHDALARHTSEDIFLRTDHHWAPLGAFYAAEAFAKSANLNFKSLESYDRNVVHNFVGSMFGYSKDISVKNSPEDFVYFTPNEVDYTTTFITYNIDNNYAITSESKPYQSPFFKKFKDGNGGAYNTFIGGDQHLVHVSTDTPTPRKLLLIKDSFGNAIPGYLFYSFSDIHIVDFRYFNRNMKKYIDENGITDILFTFNIFNACNATSMKKVKKFLTQGDREKHTSTQNQKSSPDNNIRKDSVNQDNNTKSEIEPFNDKENLEPVSTEVEENNIQDN